MICFLSSRVVLAVMVGFAPALHAMGNERDSTADTDSEPNVCSANDTKLRESDGLILEKAKGLTTQNYLPSKEALFKAVRDEDTYAITLLLKAGADPNAADEHGDTTLHHAARYSLLESIKLLLKHPSIRIDMYNKQGLTPLHIIARVSEINMDSNRIEIMRLLLERAKGIEALFIATEGSTAALMAAREGNLSALRIIHEIRPELLNKPNKEGNTPLHGAVVADNPEIVELLLDMGAEIDSPNADNLTPWQLTAVCGSPEAARALFERGVDDDEWYYSGCKPASVR
jgi:ankyrin repeat protein